MKAISQSEIIRLASDITAFADGAESQITVTQSTYAKDRQLLLDRQRRELSDLDTRYQTECTELRRRSSQAIAEAEGIVREINKLDERLGMVDKYYVKTKKKWEDFLEGTTSAAYDGATDYFTALDQLKASFQTLYRKYSEDILPGLINGLNYMFSSKRKNDYQELIVLRNTAQAFLKELNETLPPLTEETLAEKKETHYTQRGGMTERHKYDLTMLENQYAGTLDNVAGQICDRLDAILPDALVSQLSTLLRSYTASLHKVNGMDEVENGVLNMCVLDYPVNLMVQSQTVAAIIQDKCAPLMQNGGIQLPFMLSDRDAPAWMIVNDGSNTEAAQALTHAMMFGFLSACPVARLTYTVVDPENRGSSIYPFFDAKKKLPELFGERILTGREEIAARIGKLNERIEDMLQDKLGNQYDNVFEYAKSTPGYAVDVEVLVLYDFPRGFDERLLAALRNILRSGGKCGIYTVISYLPDSEQTPSHEYQKNLQSVMDLSTVIRQSGTAFTCRGLPLRCGSMPSKAEFAKFFSKYMLIYEGLKNRGIAFSPLIRKLAEARESAELERHIALIRGMMREYEQNYGRVPDEKTSFPSFITLGSVDYPADIFSDSVGYRQIVEAFGKQESHGEGAGQVELPLALDLQGRCNLFLHCPESSREDMLRLTHHVIWSFLSFLPATKANICVFDSERQGGSIIPFLDFRKRSPETFDEKLYTGQDAMYERLQRLNAQIDEFIQDKLGNKYRDILDYNLNTPNRAEPITLLVLYDFPGGMEGKSLDLLTNILRNGNRCGVFTMICYDPGMFYSKYDSIEERLERLMRFCVPLESKNGHYAMLPYNLPIHLPAPLTAQAGEHFAADYAARCERIKKQGLSFRDIMPEELFSMRSDRLLKIPVGVGDGDSIVSLTLGEGQSHHGLIAGATGSGKSTLLHTLIMSSMLHYSPDQLHLYLMDFKSGTEFKIYESMKLPHIQLLALDAMQEFGESILENLVSEMERRGELFKSVGKTSLKGYVEATGRPLPRILVIMDEFQILFNDTTNHKVAQHCAELAQRLATEGRAFGFHLLMATQSTKVISDLTLSSTTIEQMRVRIGLKCGENDARYLFTDENETKALTLMKGPIGTAVLNQDYQEQPCVGFRVAYCDDDTQREYLDRISEAFAQLPSTLQTFEGGRTTGLREYFAQAHIGMTEQLPVQIHMGTLIKVAPPFAITIDKKKKHNLLVCGTNERMADTVSNNYMISALLNRNASVYCIDGDRLVGDDGSAAMYSALSLCGGRFKAAEDRADIIRFINEVYDSYQMWKKQNSDEVIFVVIKNLQFLDIVKSMLKGESVDESEFLDESSPAPQFDPTDPFAAINSMFSSAPAGDTMPVGDKLLRLIADGSGFGIHFVVTSLEYQTVKECMYYGENTLSKFPERIIFSLGANDADSLIENVSVSGLRDNTVYFTDGVKNTFQLKPYITPSTDEVGRIFTQEGE